MFPLSELNRHQSLPNTEWFQQGRGTLDSATVSFNNVGNGNCWIRREGKTGGGNGGQRWLVIKRHFVFEGEGWVSKKHSDRCVGWILPGLVLEYNTSHSIAPSAFQSDKSPMGQVFAPRLRFMKVNGSGHEESTLFSSGLLIR